MSTNLHIYFATDHAGFLLKEQLKEYVASLDGLFDITDFGANNQNPEDDYPDFISQAAAAVSKDPENSRGIILGGSGQGEAIVANKYPHVRAVVFNGECIAPGAGDDVYEHEVALARHHNNANILSLGARFLTLEEAQEAVLLFLTTEFSDELRHVRRLKKIAAIEERNFKV